MVMTRRRGGDVGDLVRQTASTSGSSRRRSNPDVTQTTAALGSARGKGVWDVCLRDGHLGLGMSPARTTIDQRGARAPVPA